MNAQPERAGRDGDSQPMPTPNDGPDIQSLVISDLEARRELGIHRYGTALQADNGRDPVRDAYEEAMDLTVYLRQVLTEHATIGELRARVAELEALLVQAEDYAREAGDQADLAVAPLDDLLREYVARYFEAHPRRTVGELQGQIREASERLAQAPWEIGLAGADLLLAMFALSGITGYGHDVFVKEIAGRTEKAAQ